MESDWQEVARIPLPPPTPNGPPTPITSLAFDSSQELLWAGNEFGRVTSFYSVELQRYTSWRAHLQHSTPGHATTTHDHAGHVHHSSLGARSFGSSNTGQATVKQLLFCQKGVISLGKGSVTLRGRRGIGGWTVVRDDLKDLRCMSFTSKGAGEILVAGCQSVMLKIDVDKGEVLQTIPAEDHYTLMKRGGQYICAATATGSVQLLDPKTFAVLKNWKAHMGWINDMDANSSFLVTCGWSPRQHYGNMLDPLAKVFDLKTLMPLPPVPFHAGAAFVRMHPRMLTTGIIASQGGQLQVVDIMNSSMINLRQINLVDSYLVSLEIASSGEALALADSQCCIHLWGSPSRMHFADYSNPTEFPDPIPFNRPTLDWASTRPLNTIGMPYYREMLLSAWPSHIISEVGAPPAKIDTAVLAALQRTDLGAYAANPKKTRRNQVEDTRKVERALAAIEGPKFLSEQAKEGEIDSGRRMSDILEALNSASVNGGSKVDVPLMYRNVEIKYSRFGVDDFDFEYYNKTKYSGLETHIANSYLNPLLQLMRFTPCIRNLALHHTATQCLFETCLLCEMGFLFDMLEKANGQNCQASNFLKTFSNLSHTASLGLLEEGSAARPPTLMIQSTNRFLLEKIAGDFRLMSPQASHMDQILTTVAMSSIRCAHCSNETMRPGGTYVHELVYPPKTSTKGHMRSHGPSFSQILKASVERQDLTRGWCDRCKRYQQLGARKTIQSLPPVLMINAAVHSTEAKQLWAKVRWLPQEIGIIVDQGQFFCYEGQDLRMHLQRGVFKILVYELVGVVAEIHSGDSQKPNLVSMINVSPSSREKQSENHWHLFNDFLVRKISEDEALRFDTNWKLPSILSYQIKTARHSIDDSWKDNLDTSLLYRRWSLHHEEDPSHFRTLSTSERPQPGTPVGIDAEFVALQQEELEIKADGSRSTLRPSLFGLARVSVLRGGPAMSSTALSSPTASYPSSPTGMASPNPSTPSPSSTAEDEFLPFIDDYIHIPDQIVDYLTAYSGISPGDLDPKTSPYAATGRLVSLKTAYKKIWLLLNLGCVFVGHGLPKDFRTINIHVPKAQVVDTVDLYYIKARQRKLSLRFLSWYCLREMVQTGMHDSVEDARTAMMLWRKWREFCDAGVEEQVLAEIYRKGREVGYKVPLESGGGVGVGGTSFSSPSKSGVEKEVTAAVMIVEPAEAASMAAKAEARGRLS